MNDIEPLRRHYQDRNVSSVAKIIFSFCVLFQYRSMNVSTVFLGDYQFSLRYIQYILFILLLIFLITNNLSDNINL